MAWREAHFTKALMEYGAPIVPILRKTRCRIPSLLKLTGFHQGGVSLLSGHHVPYTVRQSWPSVLLKHEAGRHHWCTYDLRHERRQVQQIS